MSKLQNLLHIIPKKQLQTIIRPINAKLLEIQNNGPMKPKWDKCTNKRQLSTKQPSRMAQKRQWNKGK